MSKIKRLLAIPVNTHNRGARTQDSSWVDFSGRQNPQSRDLSLDRQGAVAGSSTPSGAQRSKAAVIRGGKIIQETMLDANNTQLLLDIAALADAREGIRQGLEEDKQGKGRDVEEFFAEFEATHGISS
jgi:hypothetical protein